MVTVMAVLTIAVGFIFAFINGFHDGCNVLASSISSRSILPKKAMLIACMAEFTGALILGTAVADTIGRGVVYPNYVLAEEPVIGVIFVLSTLLGGIVWNLITWKYGIPSSSSHALMGGLMGAGILLFGWHSINWINILFRVVIVMFTSPIIGFSIGYLFMKLAFVLLKNSSKDINEHLKTVQHFSMFFLGISHGSSDSQKSMGLIALILMVTSGGSEFYVPLWVKLGCAAAITAGLSAGGWNIIKTVGDRIYKLKPIHSFSSQIAASSVIAAASIFGSPVSTTQIVISTVMGVGAGDRYKKVNWNTVKSIGAAWFTTIPSAAAISALLAFAMRAVF
ncbi:MAG TPA: anion permease [Clostridia bacterium]|nr:anion permease [Clostridia bacterium]